MSKRKRKVLATWKVVLITMAAIIGLLGVSTFVMYLLGYFNEEIINPENINFVQDENYNAETGTYEVSADFYLTITTSTEGANVSNITLSLGNTVAENGYIDNGIIRVPQTVRLNTPFLVTLSTSYNDYTSSEYINGGITTLRATSENRLISPITTTIAVDVPVYEIDAYVYDSGDEGMTQLVDNEVVNGSQFKVKVNFTPDSTETGNSSEFMYSGTESKMIFYEPTNNYITFDYETQTFTATGVTDEGYSDTIRLYTFYSASYQEAFLSENSTITDFATLNQLAINYFSSNPESYRSCEINVTVKDVGVESFSVSNTQFDDAVVDRYLNLSSNSSSSIFDGSLGVAIRDDEGNSLNSIYAGNVGIALLDDNASIKINGERLMRVEVTSLNIAGETTYSYSITEESYSSLNSYAPTVEEIENGTITTYYFVLPSTSTSSSAANYQYQFASTEEGEASFKAALFVEGENGWEIFFTNGNNFNSLPTIVINFQVHQEENIFWNDDSRITIVYDSDAGNSDTVDLSEEINLPTDNVYQTVRYFFYSPTGAQVDVSTSLEYRSSVLYTIGEDISLSGLNSSVSEVWLYELNDANLSAIGPLNMDINLVFATVRTNADGVILNSDGEAYQSGDKYDIVLVSMPRALVVDATLKFEDMVGEAGFSSAVNGQFTVQNQDTQENELIIPALFYTDELGQSDTFEITITLNNATANMITANELQDLYNAGLSDSEASSGYLRVEFRDENGNLSTYLDEDDVERNYFDISTMSFTGTDTITGTASVTISEDFDNTDGVLYTPYLVYYNGRTLQEKEMTVSYEGQEFAGFTVYAQLAVDSEFNFVYNNTQYATNGPVYVNISEDGTREIGWTSTTGGTIDIVDIAQGLTALEQLSELLSVVIFDQYGKVIYTDAASYTLREGLEGTNRYINIVNNEITGFNSTGGETINTYITANISSIYSTDLGEEIAPENVNFEIYGAGVSRVDYDNSTDSQEHNYVSGSLAQGTVSKYLVLNDEIVLNDIIRVWVGDTADDENNYINKDETYLSFRLNSDYLAGLGDDATAALFSSQADGTDGMLRLQDAAGKDANILSYNSQNISVIHVNYLFATEGGFSLVFDVYDQYGLINIRLTLVILQNIQYVDNINSYSEPYEDYLTYGDIGTRASKLVFGGDSIILDDYLPISYFYNTSGAEDLSWTYNSQTGGTAILSVNNQSTSDLVWLGSSGEGNQATLNFGDVKTLTVVQLTLYYNSENDYTLRIDLGFVINPNYVLVQNQDFVDLQDLATGNNTLLSYYYEVYNAKEYIDRYILNSTVEDPEVIAFDTNLGLSFSSSEGSILTVQDFAINKAGSYVGNLGALIDSNISLYDTENSNNPFQFLLFDSEHQLLESECSTMYFSVGYAENAEAVISVIIDSTDEDCDDYRVLENNGKYVLVFLEYGNYTLNTNWAVNETSSYISVLDSTLSVSQLSLFNVSESIEFVYNSEDIIYIDLNLSKIGLVYVAYEENYNGDDTYFAFDDITTDETSDTGLQAFFNNMAEKNIYDEYYAGNTYTIVYEVNDEDTVENPSENQQYGFYYRNTATGGNISSSLSLYSVTEGYENIISVSGNEITLNSSVETGEDVFAILQLTLTQNLSGTITYVMYYRILIKPNYTLDDVMYPYNDDAEYMDDSHFEINFEEEFTSKNASTSKVGGSRFAKLVEIPESIPEGDTRQKTTWGRYYIYDVIVNGTSMTDYSSYLQIVLDSNGGRLFVDILDTTAEITIRVAKYYDLTMYTAEGDLISEHVEVIKSERIYTIIYNSGIPEYHYNVTKDSGEALETDDLGFYDDGVTISEEYSYTVTVQEQVGDIYNPVTDLFAHVTYAENIEIGDDEGEINSYLYEFVKLVEGDTLYTVSLAEEGLEEEYVLGEQSTITTENVGNYILVDMNNNESVSDGRLFVSIVSKYQFTIEDVLVNGYIVTLSSDDAETPTLYFLPEEEVGYFDFRGAGSNGVYSLTFLTREAISEDGMFRIGFYTSYLNIFEITFYMDGGYDITYAESFGEEVIGGRDYDVTDFVSGITKGESVLLDSTTNQFTFEEIAYKTASQEEWQTDEDVHFEIAEDGRTFQVAHMQEGLQVQIKAEHIVSENTLTIANGTTIWEDNAETLGQQLQIYRTDDSIEPITLQGFTYSTVTFQDENLQDVNYLKIDLDNELVVQGDSGEGTTLTRIDVFYIAINDEGEYPITESAIESTQEILYRFYFTLSFTASGAISSGQTLTYQESVAQEGIRYSQNQITLNLHEQDSYLYQALERYFNNVSTGISFRDEDAENPLDAFAFENGTTTYTITVPTVGETMEEYVEEIVVQYRFNGNVVFTFNLNYIFAVEPNVKISANYPTPSYVEEMSDEEKANSMLEAEYVDNNTEITNFFNTAASFTHTGANPRFYIERMDTVESEGSFVNNYDYSYTLDISEIQNVSLLVNNANTYTEPIESLRSGTLSDDGKSVINGLASMNLKFSLVNTGTTGSVVFTLTVNNVTQTYTVIVNNNSTVTMETNMITRVEDYEEIFAEDISTYSDNRLFKYGRILKYNFLNSASGTYFIRYDAPEGSSEDPLVYEVQANSSGTDVVIDLGRSYEGFIYNGIYTNSAAAYAGTSPLDWAAMFSYQPQITNRIVLLYAGYEVSRDIAEIKLSERINPTITYTLKYGVTFEEDELFYLRFDSLTTSDYVIITHSFQNLTGQQVTDELDADLEGYAYEGTYRSRANAENMEAKVTNLFTVEPTLDTQEETIYTLSYNIEGDSYTITSGEEGDETTTQIDIDEDGDGYVDEMYYIRFVNSSDESDVIVVSLQFRIGKFTEIIDQDLTGYVYDGIFESQEGAQEGTLDENDTIDDEITFIFTVVENQPTFSTRSNVDTLTYTVKLDQGSNLENTLYLRFEDEDAEVESDRVKVISHEFNTIERVEHTDILGGGLTSLGSYTFVGIFTSADDAQNNTNALSLSEIFDEDGQPVLSAGSQESFISMDNVTFDADQVANITQYSVGYDLVNDIDGVIGDAETDQTIISNNIIDTNNTYRIQLNVQFEVTTSASSHYEVVYVDEGDVSILDFATLGIRDAKTGELLTSSDITSNRRLNVTLYGFGDAQIIANSSDPLEQEAWAIHQELREGAYNTGILPRYGAVLTNNGLVGGDQTQDSNYASLNAGDDYGSDWQITPRGAAVNGNFILVKITYTTYLDIEHEHHVDVSANLRFLIMPSYDVSFKNTSEGTQYTDAIIEEMEVDGETTAVATNTAGNPYIISRSTGEVTDRTQYLYSNADNVYPIWQALLNGNNLGYTFNYTFVVNDSQAEYNSYMSTINFNDPSNSATAGWVIGEDQRTHAATTSNGSIAFGVNDVSIGDKDYYIDAIDSFGYRVRIYFRVQADITPLISNINSTTVIEGSQAEVGSTYYNVTLNGGTISNVERPKNEITSYNGWAYDYSYTINCDSTLEDVSLIVADSSNTNGYVTASSSSDAAIYSEIFEIVYVYAITETSTVEGEQVTTTTYYATSNFDKIPSGENILTYNVYINYLGNDGEDAINEAINKIEDENLKTSIREKITELSTDGLVFGLKMAGSATIVSPDGFVRSATAQTPTYGSDVALQLTLSGLTANVYNTNIIPAVSQYSFSDETNYNAESNLGEIKIASIWFEYNGEIVEYVDLNGDETYGLNGNSLYNEKQDLVVGTSTMTSGAYIYNNGVVSSPSNPGDETFTIPHFSGKLYGDSTTLENVVMVATLTTETSDTLAISGDLAPSLAQIRQSLTIIRSSYGSLDTQNFVDTEEITIDDFDMTIETDDNAKSIVVYNDTIEIEISAGGSLQYAIAPSGTSATDLNYVTLTNSRNYDHREQIRISNSETYTNSNAGTDTLQTSYTIYIRNVTSGTTYNVKYSSNSILSGSETDDYTFSLQQFGGVGESYTAPENPASIELNIEDVDELNSSGYATRYIYSIAEIVYSDGSENETEFYQQTGSLRLYPHFRSISANLTSAHDYIVDSYYEVKTNEGTSDERTYYVISPTSWAGENGTSASVSNKNPSINYTSYFTFLAGEEERQTYNNAHQIANMPYIFTYQIEAGATIDANGTVTTNEDFNIESDTVRIYVYMRVSGIDGLYSDTDGILLNSTPITFTLRSYTSEDEEKPIVDDAGIYMVGESNSLIILNEGDSVYAKGGANTTATALTTSSVASAGTYLVPTNQAFVFENRFDKTTQYESETPEQTTIYYRVSNNEFRIVQADDADRDYIYHGNLDSYTYSSSGEYTSMFVESYRYVTGTDSYGAPTSQIGYRVFTANIVVYNSQAPNIYSAEYTTSEIDGTTSSFVENDSSYTLTLASPTVTDYNVEMSTTEVSGTFYDVETGKQIVADIDGNSSAENETQIAFDRFLDSDISGIKTKEIVAVEEGGIFFYRITFFVYNHLETTEEIALAPNTTYVLSNLLGNGTFYQLNNYNNETVTTKNYPLQANTEVTEYFYVFINNTLVKHEVKFNLYNTSTNINITSWVREDTENEALGLSSNTATINIAYDNSFETGEADPTAENESKFYVNATTSTLYQNVNGEWRVVADLSEYVTGTISWLSGTGQPNNTVGADNDIYLDTLNFTIYQKVSGEWASLNVESGFYSEETLFDRLGYSDVVYDKDNGTFTRTVEGETYTYKLYEVDSINELSEIIDSSYTIMETSLSGNVVDWTNSTRVFFVEQTHGDTTTYRRCTIVFYKFADDIEVNAITQYNNYFQLSNLDSIAKAAIQEVTGETTDAELTWWNYNSSNYTLNSATVISIGESTVDANGQYIVSGQFYVLMSDKYYRVDLNITCAEARASYQVYVANESLESAISLKDISLYTFDENGNLAFTMDGETVVYTTEALMDYINREIGLASYTGFTYEDTEVKFYEFDDLGNSIVAGFDGTEIENVDLTATKPFVKNVNMVYYIKYDTATETDLILYAILNINFVVQNEPLGEKHFFSGTTSGQTFDLNTITTQVRQNFDLSSSYITYYLDANGENVVTGNTITLTTEERAQNYILKEIYFNDGSSYVKIILIIQNTNVLEASGASMTRMEIREEQNEIFKTENGGLAA